MKERWSVIEAGEIDLFMTAMAAALRTKGCLVLTLPYFE